MAVEMVAETERLLLREYEERDIDTVQEYASLTVVVQYQNWGPNTLADTHRFFQETRDSKTQSPRLTYALCIERKEDGRQIGGCEIVIDPTATQQATIGFVIHPAHWNQGFATEVTKGLIAFAREELALSLIIATCDARNVASRRVLEKSGFILEHVIKNDFLQKGEMRTTLVFKHQPAPE